jgi:hypothetical protein
MGASTDQKVTSCFISYRSFQVSLEISNRLRSRIDKDKFLLAGTCFWLQLLRSSEVLHRTTQGSSAPLATQHAGAREGTASMHAENPHHLAIPL